MGNKITYLTTGYIANVNSLGRPSSAPTPHPNLRQVVLNETHGISHYNSLQAPLNHRATNQLTLTTFYTLAHVIDNPVTHAPRPGHRRQHQHQPVLWPEGAECDVALFKTLHFTERFGTELRAEIYNMTSTPQFANPDTNLADGSFGQINGTR